MVKKKFTLTYIFTGFFIINIIFTCSGCWDRRELKSLAIISGIALDQAPNSDEVQATIQILNISQLSSGQGGGGGKGGGENFTLISAQGPTVYDAVLRCTHQTTRQLFFSHAQVLLIGEDLARAGIGKYLDFFLRNKEVRDTIWVMVTKGSAADLLSTKSTLEQVSSQALAKMVDTRAVTSGASGVNLYELTKRISGKSYAPLTSYIIKTQKKDQESFILSQTAVFNRHLQMIGTLSERETRGLLWAINQAHRGVLVIETPESNGYTSLEVLRSKGEMKPEIKDGRLQFKIKIHAVSIVQDTQGKLNMESPKVWQSLQSRGATVIKNDITMALEKSRQLNVDIFGLGDLVYKRYPEQWKQMQANWQDIYNNVPVQIVVQLEMRRSGLLRNSVNP